MSYCRFQNTLADLQDCKEHINDQDLSSEELKAKQEMIGICSEISFRSSSLSRSYRFFLGNGGRRIDDSK